jgi:hypothetical protein
MEQLLLHLLGDYITQTDWMAQNKTKNHLPALVHAVIYTLPFLLLSPSVKAAMVILLSHYVIDHWRLARYVNFGKNWIFDHSIKWRDCRRTGYSMQMAPHMADWLMILTDNTMHLFCNYAALRWL